MNGFRSRQYPAWLRLPFLRNEEELPGSEHALPRSPATPPARFRPTDMLARGDIYDVRISDFIDDWAKARRALYRRSSNPRVRANDDRANATNGDGSNRSSLLLISQLCLSGRINRYNRYGL